MHTFLFSLSSLYYRHYIIHYYDIVGWKTNGIQPIKIRLQHSQQFSLDYAGVYLEKLAY